jgi:predicted kinase
MPAPIVVVVTGVPGAGKSTLAQALAPALGAELLSLDALKESIFASGDHVDDRCALRFAAEAALRDRLLTATGSVVVDVWVAPDRDEWRIRPLLTVSARPVVELMCRVPAGIAVERYRLRTRSGPHRPADPETLERIRDAVAKIRPLELGRCIDVDTGGPVDLPALVARVTDLARTSKAPEPAVREPSRRSNG